MELLVEYAEKYKEYYVQPMYPIFHIACGCVVAQQVSFAIGRNIRKNLYELCGFPLTRENITEKDLTVIKHLTSQRIRLLKEMALLDDTLPHILDEYAKLKGFGSWSYDAVSLLIGKNNINLSSDAYIRKNLVMYTKIKMTQKECHSYIDNIGDDKSNVCYFLWRIKPLSIKKISDNQILIKEDFI